ncbi:MAG TPA: tripartite tricarboxylate transporter substrate-binding protein [Burkholderiales bacterium]|nr:tripartite tricarboxylate transporter substrate-binding protein [Burkholderiales bacterium]
MKRAGPSLGRRQFLKATGAVAAATLAPMQLARGQDVWPSKPIKLVIGFAPGGITDGLPRLYAPVLAEKLGVPVVIDNKSGAAGNIATTFVATAPPDGYTLLASGVGQIVVLPHTSKMSVNPLTDLIHVSMLADGDQILNINSEVPAKTLAEFIALAKKRPGTLNYGDAGAGGNQHLYLEYFKMLAGVDILGVHYRGGGPLMPDLLSNRVQLGLNAPSVVLPYIEQGKLRPLMLVGPGRNPKLPNVPTAAEVGLKPMEACSNWLGLHAPKGTPDAIVQKLYRAIADTMQTDTVKKGMAALNIYPIISSPADFSARIKRDYELFGKVAKAANVQAE